MILTSYHCILQLHENNNVTIFKNYVTGFSCPKTNLAIINFLKIEI
jgi:hypothetical protein